MPLHRPTFAPAHAEHTKAGLPQPIPASPSRKPVGASPRLVLSLVLGLVAAPASLAADAPAGGGLKAPGWGYRSLSGWARDLVSEGDARGAPPRAYVAPEEASIDLPPADGVLSTRRMGRHLRTIPLEVAGTAAALTAVGFTKWGWGDSKFFVRHEGGFGRQTNNGGMDKLGHFYTTFVMADLMADRIRANAGSAEAASGAEWSAAAFAWALMLGVEIGDGYTRQYGFSTEDLLADTLGAGFAVWRARTPGARRLMDFRLLYVPSAWEREGNTTSNLMVPPYRRSRYLLAFKGSGIDALSQGPARYLELHVGYDARGFSSVERRLGHPKERSGYGGLGLNLSELVFGRAPAPGQGEDISELGWAGRKYLEYYQVPWTSAYNR
ncbi:MAG: hypothetical protein RL722_2520 [Pseudomonadota bacterium]|jgi:hypothetical protein